MDYFNDVLTVSGPGNISVTFLSIQGQKGGILSKNIYICVPKMNKGLTSLEQHEYNDNLHFWVKTIPLRGKQGDK